MKLWIALATAALMTGAPSAGAQCAGGAGNRGPGLAGPGQQTVQNTPTEIVLKVFGKHAEPKPAGLKAALEKLRTVSKVEFAAGAKTVLVTYTGKCDQLGELETAALAAGYQALVLNHAHVVIALKSLKGGDPTAAAAEIAAVEGVVGVIPGTTGLEVHADLEKLTMERLRAAAAKFSCDVLVNQTFEYVRYKVVEGRSGEFAAAASLINGVMVLREEGEGVVGMWIHKTMLKCEQIEKLPDYKVERM